MKGMLVLHLLLYALFLTAWSATGHVAMRAHLTHIDSGRGFTKRDLLRRMAARTRARVDKRWSPLGLRPPPPLPPQPQPPPPPPQPQPGGGANDTGLTAWVSRGTVGRDSEYLIHFGIGTPTQPVALTLDTSSDLIWTQCACKSCFDQPFQFLDTSASSTLKHVPCTDRVCTWGGLPLSGCTVNDNMCFYVHSYGNDTFTTGKLSEDTFTFQAPSGKPVAMRPSLRFGCGMYNTGNFTSKESGMAGFGRGLLSLPKQLNVTRFSYCFTAINESGNSSVFLGTYGNLSAQAQSTPFARGPKGPNSSLYYLSLLGVTVGTKRLPFDASAFGLKGDGSGGTIIDSGTGITTFPRAVFRTLRGEFESQTSLPVTDGSADPDSMLCFSSSMPGVYVPPLILHLEGADWQLPRGNYVLDSSDDNTTCVVINSSGDNGITIIGNFQQQNMHIAYDLGSNKLFFEPARCNEL